LVFLDEQFAILVEVKKVYFVQKLTGGRGNLIIRCPGALYLSANLVVIMWLADEVAIGLFWLQRRNGNVNKRLTGWPSWRKLLQNSDSGRLRLRRGRSVKEKHYDQRLRTSLANSSHLHFARDWRQKNPGVVVWNFQITGMTIGRPIHQWRNVDLYYLQAVHKLLAMNLSVDHRWKLTVLLCLLQTGINLLEAVSHQRSQMQDQELMNLHEEGPVTPMLLHVEVQGMVEVVIVMDHHLALHVPYMGADCQRIAGALEVGVQVGLIVNAVPVTMSDQTFGGEVPVKMCLHGSLKNRLLNSGCAQSLCI
jgi:hypothetical protein